MSAFTCYRLHQTLRGHPPADLDEFIDIDEKAPEIFGPVDLGDFVAKLYVNIGDRYQPGWAGFVRTGFRELADLPMAASVGAAVVVKLVPEEQYFAFTFGTTGRYLLRHEAWQRGYGLQAALNLVYPRTSAADGETGKLIAIDAKRRGGQIIRSRLQSSKATTFETFDVDKVRAMVGGATGEPSDRRWGSRVSGADALNFAYDSDFAGLGQLCRDLSAAHDRDDYKDRFAWLDSVRPIHDPEHLARIEQHLVTNLLAGDVTDLELAPPEVIDWSRVVGFQYHFEFRGRQSVNRPEMRLSHYLSGLAYHDDTSVVDIDFLRRRSIRARDADDHTVHSWSVWRCLTGEFEFEGGTYVIDEGEIFAISTDFLADLNDYLSRLPVKATMPWPAATPHIHEDAYNVAVAGAMAPALVMDQKLVNARTQTTPVEVCDVLTASRQLIHVKRHLSSGELSHLFSQGFVSASLLQSDAVFREAAHQKIKELGGGEEFRFFDVPSLSTTDFEIIFVIVAAWRARSLADALPFFSKINLERTAADLINRGFKVALALVDYGPQVAARPPVPGA